MTHHCEDQAEMFGPIDKSTPGVVWWAGSWECRNKDGYYQTREGGRGPWEYVIYAFGEDDALIYRLTSTGELVHEAVPIDGRNRISLNGRKYGRNNWRH